MATEALMGQDLCEVCRKISMEALLAANGFEHISDLELLGASAEQCRVCALIYQSIFIAYSTPSTLWEIPSDSSRFTILRGVKRENLGLDHILVCCGFIPNTFEHWRNQTIAPQGTYLVGRLDISAEEEDPAAKFVTNRRLPRDPGSEDSMFMVAQLLDECRTMHPRCKAQQITSLPTRVLDVGSIGDDKISLLISKGRKARYTALSYCWGGPQEFVAKEDSLEAMTQGIALSMLPKTIQDAVTVTRALHFQYLWVDVLCIRQDSEKDWTSESSKMADIYGNATVTIAASGGSNCSAGCFIKASSDSDYGLERIRLRLPNSVIGTISLCVQTDFTPYRNPLAKRAWALQERLLSPRLLIYGIGSVSWQCQTKVHPYGIGYARLPDFFLNGTAANSDEMWEWNKPLSDHDDITLETRWVQVALDYSQRDITYDHDRLPALSGLARKFRDVTGDVYLAGLWKGTLTWGLMWCTPRADGSRPATYIAPTWSWLSIRGPIYYREREDSHLLKILEAETVSVGSDETGAVSSGKITLCGQMKRAQVKDTNKLWGLVMEKFVEIGRILEDFESELLDAIDGSLWCLRVFENHGLIIKPLGENYQRIGIFDLYLDGESDGPAGITCRTWFEDSDLQTLTLV